MNKIVSIIGVVIVVLVGIGFFVQIGESIPENAQIDVFPSSRYWIPSAPIATEKLKQSLANENERINTLKLLEEITPATWGDVKSGKYKGFTLPSGWKTYTESYTTGYNVSLIRYLVSPPKSRWNPDGSWNY